jgi:hypothetical protein
MKTNSDDQEVSSPNPYKGEPGTAYLTSKFADFNLIPEGLVEESGVTTPVAADCSPL